MYRDSTCAGRNIPGISAGPACGRVVSSRDVPSGDIPACHLPEGRKAVLGDSPSLIQIQLYPVSRRLCCLRRVLAAAEVRRFLPDDGKEVSANNCYKFMAIFIVWC